MGEPGQEDGDEDQDSKHLHAFVFEGHQRQDNEAPVDELPQRLGVDEVVPDGVDVVDDAPSFNGWLDQFWVEKDGYVEDIKFIILYRCFVWILCYLPTFCQFFRKLFSEH